MNAKQARDQSNKAIKNIDVSEYITRIDKLICEKPNIINGWLDIRYDYFKDYNERMVTINHYGKNGFIVRHNHRYAESFRISW